MTKSTGANKPAKKTTKKDVTPAAKAAKDIGVSPDDMDQPKTEPQAEIVIRDPEPDAGSSALATTDSREAVLSIVGGVTTAQLKEALTVQTEQRQLIKQFIQDNLEDGTDYGKIHVVKNCPMETKQPGSCTRDYHYSKSILMKPGQEKIFSLFSITDELERDDEAYEMMPDVKGLVAYKCTMFRGDKRLGEGRGAAVLTSERSDPNSTIKKAEKRARMDACLSLGFSAYFTQDLDDPDYKAQRDMMISKTAAEADRRDKDDLGLWIREDPTQPLDDDERKMLFATIHKAGYQDPDIMLELLAANGVADPKAMKSGQAREMIRNIRAGNYTPIAVRTLDEPDNPDEVITDIDDADPSAGLDAAVDELDKKATPEPEELVVDDDLKSHVKDLFDSIGLNARGQMWFKQYVSGRPFGDFSKFTDDNWRKAFQFVQDIMDQRVEVADEYVAGVISSDPDAAPPRDFSSPTSDQPGQAQKQVAAIFPGAETPTAPEPSA